MKNYINFIEEISLNAWPAHKTELYDGWLLRYSHNYTHRTNSINLIAPSIIPLEEKIKYCEEEYSKKGSPAIFKISPTIEKDFDKYLEDRGYVIEHKANVMVGKLEHKFNPNPNINVILSDVISDDWIFNLFRLNKTTNKIHHKIVPAMYHAIPRSTICAKIEDNDVMVASGLGVLERGHVGLYAIYVDENYRQKGYARAICENILNAAIDKEATNVYLQVVYENTPAQNLYSSLGLKYFYTYWFRTKYINIQK